MLQAMADTSRICVCVCVCVCVCMRVCVRFKMAETIDSELKGIARDLKEIIEEMNTANTNQDQSQSTVSGWDGWVGQGSGRGKEGEEVLVVAVTPGWRHW